MLEATAAPLNETIADPRDRMDEPRSVSASGTSPRDPEWDEHTVDDPPSFGSLARRGAVATLRGELALRESSRPIEIGVIDHHVLDILDDSHPGMAMETIEVFVGQVPESLAHIDEAHVRGDAVALHGLFRSLCTSARAVGASHLAGLSQAAAELAREGDLEAIAGLNAEIEQEYGHVFRSLMDRHPSSSRSRMSLTF